MSSVAQLTASSFGAHWQAGEMHHGAATGVVLLAVATCAWALEARCRTGRAAHTSAGEIPVAPPGEGLIGGRTLEGAAKLCKHLVPEACGLVAIVIIAGALLLWGAGDAAPGPEEDKEIWEQIRAQWPVLVTADSLLSLRAMLRALLLLSAVLRTDEALRSPLAGGPAALLLLAAISRVALLALSPHDVYHLDGPLGGIGYMALEVAALGPLLFLAAAGALDAGEGPSLPRVLATAAVLMLIGLTAATNHLALGGPEGVELDVLFSVGELLETAAAAAFLLRVLGTAGLEGAQSPFAALAHALLPVQQLMSAYFLLTAWGGAPLEEIPALVGAGRPFEVLQIGGAAQVLVYAMAGAVQVVLVGAAEKEPLQDGELLAV